MLRFTERFMFVNTAVNNSGNLLSIITCVKIYCLSEDSWNDYSYDLGVGCRDHSCDPRAGCRDHLWTLRDTGNDTTINNFVDFC